MAEQDIFDISVVGAGPAGLIAGAACAQSGLRTVIIGPPSNRDDRRTSALFGGSIELLKRLDILERLGGLSEPITGIRIVDGSASLLRAPEVLFEAREAGFEAFGYNIPNAALTEALEGASGRLLTRVPSGVTEVKIGSRDVTLTSDSGEKLASRLVVAADGRSSATRAAAGIEVSNWTYPQSAIVAMFHHQRDHHGISTELHRSAGPLTVVPGPGKTSNLVWIDTHEEVARLLALDDQAFCGELSTALKGLLGALSDFTPRQSFRLSGQTARSLAKSRVVLVGEAAHVIPPIGAQGLNLSCRDAAALADIAGEAKRSGVDIGGEATLKRYENARQADVGSRVFAVDLLNRSLLSNIPGVSIARGFGLFALASSPALRARVMREGVMPTTSHHQPSTSPLAQDVDI
ncbi:FAD-dependent monooxygenase [Hyphomicrobium sp.]|jgi:2-octaprenyl-6-methoxyphenol hydroxylase|uniref:FAD-dependent monooxygenase n=1 Tax=Hyphomicrobium sp. TaxID=82 RepID=UPI003561C1A1